MWGRLNRFDNKVMDYRNTPTCVGKTRATSTRLQRVEKHPHVCGEDYCALHKSVLKAETPPRVWGRQLDFVNTFFVTGNTPTCVGKTLYQ